MNLYVDSTVLERSYNSIQSVLVITDAFTKWTKTIPTRDQTTKTVTKAPVEEWCYHQGVPKMLCSDQGRNLEGKVIQQLCSMYGNDKSMTTSHSYGNSISERYNRTMSNLLRTLEADQKRKCPKHLHSLRFNYNVTPHASTGYSPYFMVCGIQPTLNINNYLGIAAHNAVATIVDWVKHHHETMTESHQLGSQRLEEEAKKRNTHHGG